MSDRPVPAALARLWRLPVPARQGRPPVLDVDRIVTAAVELADRHDIAAVTLEKVAQTLGFTKMALYRHVGSKDELLTLMVDHALGSPPDDLGAQEDWRASLTAYAHALRAVYTARGWLLRVPIAGPPQGPNTIAWLDAQLRALRDIDLDAGTALGLLMVLDGYIRQSCLLEQQLRTGRGERRQDDVEYEYGRTLARLVDPDRFPDAARLFGSDPFPVPGAPERDPAEEDFRFGLHVVLDGIAAALHR
ncbi:TetR/AcrR family transcriptional regulator [Nocardia pseudobrasiliensis]|uniref:TetR family transcriptional regulator n=1 Tax=Nocardia pseudobrasiliensis TaxID=45979 RepID=A0A370IAR9_9NOCA|nr:TetR/AcrR family transcriptional regulator [Nocardia pseudobrasiliensis]RDI67807.1 TetR family transcriptional regulator [Nocardia pseudobrasiliensis]